MNDLKSCRNCARLGKNDRICQACRDQNRWVAMKPPQTDYTAYSGTAYPFPRIKKVIFNDPATIVLWDDNTKTVVKCSENDDFDWEKGLAMAISKKFFGNQGNYYNNFKKWEPEDEGRVILDFKISTSSAVKALENMRAAVERYNRVLGLRGE